MVGDGVAMRVTVTDFNSEAERLLDGNSTVSEKDAVRASVSRDAVNVRLLSTDNEKE